MAGEPRFGAGGVAFAEFACAVVEGAGELPGDRRGAGRGAVGPGGMLAGVGELEAL